jgi:hypothetical protein
MLYTLEVVLALLGLAVIALAFIAARDARRRPAAAGSTAASDH